MVVGLVYQDVDGFSDPRGDLAMIKMCLAEEFSSVVPVQIGSYSHAETAYTNEAGGSFLRSIRSEIQQLSAETKDLRAENKDLRAETKALRAENKDLRKESGCQKEELNRLRGEMTVLRPLRDNAICIRKRFFAIAHSGDVITDVYLLEKGYMHCFEAFKILYGMDLKLAKALIEFPHMVRVMNCRASLMAEAEGLWKMEQDYQELARWTKNVTPQYLALFNADSIGNMHYNRLYLRLPHYE
ncbi:hypothetical protein HOY80DRAFT_1133629 [Tuber brumale]|nr:hypothetical protein HOY80DRAFT_1133629 [Tuber brumale]